MRTAWPLFVSAALNSGKNNGLSPLLLKIEPENKTLALFPKGVPNIIWPFFSPKLPKSVVRLDVPASSGDFVMMLMVAKIPLLPYKADEGPRMISIRFMRFMSMGKSLPKNSTKS